MQESKLVRVDYFCTFFKNMFESFISGLKTMCTYSVLRSHQTFMIEQSRPRAVFVCHFLHHLENRSRLAYSRYLLFFIA